MPTEVRRMRADARRNRERLVVAAVELFVEQGVDVPLEAIARRADVGIGTLYRHFADRRDLAEAVALECFATVRKLAYDAVGQEPDRAGMHEFLMGIADLGIGVLMASLYPLLTERPSNEDLVDAFDATLDAVEALVTHARATRQLREDVTADDVILLLALLTQPLQGTTEEYISAMTPRLLHLLLEGLQPAPNITVPPPAPPSPEDVR
jgi:AcrR family transcriptional regulator